MISQDKVFSKLFFPIKFPVITEVKLDFEEDTNVKYLSSINPFPLGSKPLQPAPGIYIQPKRVNLTQRVTDLQNDNHLQTYLGYL